MINENYDELLRKMEFVEHPLVREFTHRLLQDGVTSLDELLEYREEAEEKLEGLAQELGELETKTDREIEALEGRIEACENMLDRLRQRLNIDETKMARSFGPEYDWIEHVEEIAKEYAPEMESVSAAYIKETDGCVDEVWVTGYPNYHGNSTLYWRVY